MADKILHSDLVESGNPFEEAIKYANVLKSTIQEIKNAGEIKIKASIENIQGVAPNSPSGQPLIAKEASSIDKLAASMQSASESITRLNSNIKTLTDSMNKYKNISSKMSDDEKKGLIEAERAAASLLRQKQKALEVIARQEAKERDLTAAMKMQVKSIEDLQRQNNALVAARKKVDLTTKQGREEYDRLTNAIKHNSDELKKHDAKIGNHQRSVGNYVMAIRNAWFGWMAAISGTVMAIKQYISMNAELDDAMASVRRTTGMTQAEVYGLNETLRSFDTRTSQKSLLDLAHVAGKLGIAKDDIAGFVKAADMIGVALGKDIGNNEEAINQLGRVVQIFKLDVNDTMERALLKVGSAIKDLGNASVAEEVNILDFTKRLGGLAPAAGISVDKIMALAATYDILGQTMEVSSTATSQIWIGMAQKTEQFARIAGMATKDFSALMKRDFNEAFIAFVTGLQKGKGGIEELASYFDGLGLDGRRIIGVMTVLSDKIGVYRDQMRISKQSLDEGATAAQQFAIQNETLAASIEKLNKSWRNFLANSGSVDAFRRLIDRLGASFDNLSDKLSDDKLRNLKSELESLKFNAPDGGYPLMSAGYRRIVELEKEIVLEEQQRKKNVEVNKTIEARIKAERELIVELRTRFGLKSPDEERKYMATQRAFFPSSMIRGKGIMEQSDLVPTESDYGNLKFDKEVTDAANKKAIEDAKRRQEAYYQFLLKLGYVTIDQIVEHERQALVESGAWQLATKKQQNEWITAKYDELITAQVEASDKQMEELAKLEEDRWNYQKELGMWSWDEVYNHSIKKMMQTKEYLEANPIKQKVMLEYQKSKSTDEANKYGDRIQGIGMDSAYKSKVSQSQGLIKTSGDSLLADASGNLPETLNYVPNPLAQSEQRPFDSFFKPKQWQSDLQQINAVMQEWASSVSSILGSMTQQYQQEMDAQLVILDNRYAREYEMLDEGVKNKTMSELKAANKKTELEKKQRAEQLKIEKEYKEKQRDLAIIQAIINIAVGVTQALAGSPPPLNFIAAALVGVAGAAEIATISSQKFAKGGSGKIDEKKGGVLVGKSHSQGGIQLNGIGEAEGGEYFGIINRDATRQYEEVLPDLFRSINDRKLVLNNGFIEDHSIIRDHINSRMYDKMFNKKAMPNITVNVHNPYGKEMLEEMRKKRPQTHVIETDRERIMTTGNYTLITKK